MIFFHQVRDLIMNFVLSSNSAFRIIENPVFSNLVNYVSCGQAKIPTRKTFMYNLKSKYDETKSQLISIIDKAKYVCMTADIWINKA